MNWIPIGDTGWFGLIFAFVINSLAILATWRITKHILNRVDEVADSLKAISDELKDRHKDDDSE